MNPKVQKTLELTPELLRATGEELGWLQYSEQAIVERIEALSEPTEKNEAVRRSRALLKGSLLLYLFALWESHLPTDYKQWMSEEELLEFEAFEHVRDSVAHAKLGERATFNRKRKAFESFAPFAGVSWNRNTDTIDISESFVVDEFFTFMMGMSSQLAARLHGNIRPKK